MNRITLPGSGRVTRAGDACHFDRFTSVISTEGRNLKGRALMPEMNLAVDPGWKGLGGRW